MGTAEDEWVDVEVRTYFVRHRNVLLARAAFSPLFMAYYLHQADHQRRSDPVLDNAFKSLLAAMVLHAAARPHKETMAWTVHFEEPLANLFVTASNPGHSVVGTIFDQDVRAGGENLFLADTHGEGNEPRRSAVHLEGINVLQAVEHFYSQSEQRLARMFHLDEEDMALLVAQPDCDEAWLRGLTDADLPDLDRREELSLLERRPFRWFCGCSEVRMMDVLSGAMRQDPDSLFGEDPSLRMSCPRCGARYVITREGLEAHLSRPADLGSDDSVAH